MIVHYTLKMDMLPVHVEIVIGLQMLRRYVNKYKLHHHEGLQEALLSEHVETGICGMMCQMNDYTYLIVLPDEYDAGTTYHECLHAANQLWYNVGARLTTDNDEVIAYTMNYIARFIEEVCYVSD